MHHGQRQDDISVEAVVDEFLEPAVDRLRRAARREDAAGLRDHAYEVIAVAGAVIHAAKDRSPNPDPASRHLVLLRELAARG